MRDAVTYDEERSRDGKAEKWEWKSITFIRQPPTRTLSRRVRDFICSQAQYTSAVSSFDGHCTFAVAVAVSRMSHFQQAQLNVWTDTRVHRRIAALIRRRVWWNELLITSRCASISHSLSLTLFLRLRFKLRLHTCYLLILHSICTIHSRMLDRLRVLWLSLYCPVFLLIQSSTHRETHSLLE